MPEWSTSCAYLTYNLVKGWLGGQQNVLILIVIVFQPLGDTLSHYDDAILPQDWS